MLRLIPLALLLSVLALAGCGSDDEDAASTTAATETQAAAEPVRVGLVVDKGQLDDNGFNELAFRGVTARRGGAGSQGTRRRVRDRGRLHPEHDLAGARAATTS